MLDATEGVVAIGCDDQSYYALAKAGRALIICVNKWDQM